MNPSVLMRFLAGGVSTVHIITITAVGQNNLLCELWLHLRAAYSPAVKILLSLPGDTGRESCIAQILVLDAQQALAHRAVALL